MLILVLDDEKLLMDEECEMEKAIQPEAEVRGFLRSTAALLAVKEEKLYPDIAFVDIEMPGMNGLEFAQELKNVSPRTNIIFVTGFSQYAADAFALHSSGYILKPVSEERLMEEIQNLRFPVQYQSDKKVVVQCFGNFDVFLHGELMDFPRTRSKEIFAYLVYKRGTSCTAQELEAVLYEDEPYTLTLRDNTRKYIQTMIHAFQEAGLPDVIIKKHNSVAVNTDLIDCDYYRYLKMDPSAINAYCGEFMQQYSWAVFDVGGISSYDDM